jgi:hypothetical protein
MWTPGLYLGAPCWRKTVPRETRWVDAGVDLLVRVQKIYTLNRHYYYDKLVFKNLSTIDAFDAFQAMQ